MFWDFLLASLDHRPFQEGYTPKRKYSKFETLFIEKGLKMEMAQLLHLKM